MRIAITGGIAEGKTTVLGIVESLGYSVASADDIAARVFARADVQRRLAEFAGASASLSREELRAALSRSDALRSQVNSLMHPLIAEELLHCKADFIEVPLLIETCLQGEFDRVWVVTCGVPEQRRRLVGRYGSETQANRFMATQLPTKMKIAFADRVIRTNRPLANVRRLVSEAVTHVLA